MQKITKTIGLFLLYLFVISSPDIILGVFGIDYQQLSLTIKATLIIIIEALFTGFLIYLFKKDIIPNFKDFIKNFKQYFKKYFWYWILMILLMSISNMIIVNLTNITNPENQQAIIDEFEKAPLYSFILVIFIAPIMEEIIFRLSIRKLIKNKYFYIIFSGLLFGLLHVIGSDNLLNYLFIIPYSIPGIIFAHTLVKSDNIFVPISLHFINNLFSTILLLV